MQTLHDDHQYLAERIDKLERQNRFWKIGGLVAIVALAVSLTASVWAQEQVLPQGAQRAFRAQTVEAEHFVLKNGTGQTEGELTVTPQGPVLNLYGPGGRIFWSTSPHPFAQAASSATAKAAGE